MFIHASARTDIANYYSEWLMNRLREGYVLSRNPYFPHKVYRYRLSPDVVDCLIFCTKNPLPMLDHIDEVRSRGFSVFFYVTVTGYGKDVEPGVPDYREMMDVFRELSGKAGRECVCWRYDPVFITEKYTVRRHLQCFEEMAEGIAPYTDLCIFSFVEVYKKLAVNFPEVRAVSGREKEILLTEMARIAGRCGIRLQTCGDGNDYTAYGIGRSGCITVPLMEKAIGRKLRNLRARPAREGCGCVQSHDIGAYNTCPNGCRYCYATDDARLAVRNFRAHDPKSPLLTGNLRPEDEIIEADQKSFLEPMQQLSLDL